MWFVVSAGGVLSKKEFLDEIQRNKVCPLLCYKDGDKSVVPSFADLQLALGFAHRNTSKSDCIGAVSLDDSERQALLNSGFEFETLTWPCKREVFVHVLFLEREVETIETGLRRK